MKLQFYHEGLTEKFERFTLFGVQINKNEDDEVYLVVWFFACGFCLVFNDK